MPFRRPMRQKKILRLFSRPEKKVFSKPKVPMVREGAPTSFPRGTRSAVKKLSGTYTITPQRSEVLRRKYGSTGINFLMGKGLGLDRRIDAPNEKHRVRESQMILAAEKGDAAGVSKWAGARVKELQASIRKADVGRGGYVPGTGLDVQGVRSDVSRLRNIANNPQSFIATISKLRRSNVTPRRLVPAKR